MKDSIVWYSERLERDIRISRWGHWGRPVLLFPTAGGDADEVERMGMVGAVWPLIEAGRIKLYSIDSVAGRAWIEDGHSTAYRCLLQNRFDACIYHEVVPHIRRDCRSDSIDIVSAGASLGAFNAVASLCRHPDVFGAAIGMSGTYDLGRFCPDGFSMDLFYSSPIHYLPGLADSEQLYLLRQRFVLLTYVGGRWEDPDETWRLAGVLGQKGVPNRVVAWGSEYDHDWPAWRAMLPIYLDELL
jgi:esterase/lipase superfamily enzyme